LVKQLRTQLGEEEYTKIEDVEVISKVIEIKDPQSAIQEIDKMLKNPDLTEDQVNELLDKRANL